MSLHRINNYAQKRGIVKMLRLTIRALMLEEHVDLVAGDFNGAAWCLPCGNDRKPTSIIEEAFADTDATWPTPLWGPGAVPGEQADVCGFLLHERCKVRLHGPFSVPHSTLGLREKEQSCHHEVWMHLTVADHRGDLCTAGEA